MNERLRNLIDEQYTKMPFYGVEKMTQWLRRQGFPVNPKRVRRLMRLMGLEAAGVRISMDGRGRVFGNIFIERLWRSVKYEEVCAVTRALETPRTALRGASGFTIPSGSMRLWATGLPTRYTSGKAETITDRLN